MGKTVPDSVSESDLARDKPLSAWLAARAPGENMTSAVRYVKSARELSGGSVHATLLDGRLVKVGHSSPNRGEPGLRVLLVQRQEDYLAMSATFNVSRNPLGWVFVDLPGGESTHERDGEL